MQRINIKNEHNCCDKSQVLLLRQVTHGQDSITCRVMSLLTIMHRSYSHNIWQTKNSKKRTSFLHWNFSRIGLSLRPPHSQHVCQTWNCKNAHYFLTETLSEIDYLYYLRLLATSTLTLNGSTLNAYAESIQNAYITVVTRLKSFFSHRMARI